MTDYPDFTGPTNPARFQRLPPDCPPPEPMDRPNAAACGAIMLAAAFALGAAVGFGAGVVL